MYVEESSDADGGGDSFEECGTLLDRVYGREDDDLLGVRTITRTNGTSTRSEVRFFRLLPSGELVDDAPLESFCWELARDDFPLQDPLGTRAELVPGLEREREVRFADPLFRSFFRDPVPVHEVVAAIAPAWLREQTADPRDLESALEELLRSYPERIQATLERSWKAPDDEGLATEAGSVRLLSLEDRATFELGTGRVLDRTTELSWVRPGSPMIQIRRRTMREVAWWGFHDERDKASSLSRLREAYRRARLEPREAERLLAEWSRAGAAPQVAQDVALLSG